jgi:hypothetical protein
MPKSINSDETNKPLKINQANAFYNYVLGFDSTNVDLLNTAVNFLKEGVSTSVFFSDFKYMYHDQSGKRQIEIIKRKGRDFDSNWELDFNDVPENIAVELLRACEIAFHENSIYNEHLSYIRVALPPVFLESDNLPLPLIASVKIYSDGLAILSFQLDATWDQLDEESFLSDIVNIYKYYFKSIWVDSTLQKLDAKVSLENAFEDEFSIGGKSFTSWKIKRLIKKCKRESKQYLDESLEVEGTSFNLGGVDWQLHQIVGTDNNESMELNLELCRSIYCNAISSLLVSEQNQNKSSFGHFMWQGRPSITLLRFEGQPEFKEELLRDFSHSMSKILLRADKTVDAFELPSDLRVFDDFCLHANRAIFLWTWLKSEESTQNVWDDENTTPKLFESQTRVEHIEYYNMKVARACTMAQKPLTSDDLLYAYSVLASTDSMIHQSSKSGEIIDTLIYLMEQFGTTGLVDSSKESARFHLDEFKYKSDRARNRGDSRLSFIFGLVGAASLAQFAVHPFVIKTWPSFSEILGPIVSFLISGTLIMSITTILWLINRGKN